MMTSVVERRLFLQGIVLIACASMPSLSMATPKKSPAGNPADVISAIYRRTIKDGGGNFVWQEAADRPHFLSKALVALWAKADALTPTGEGPGGFDFITDTNGLTIGSFKSVLEKSDAERAVVAVTIGYKEKTAVDKGRHVLRYDLVREDAAWKVDNIKTTTWDLRRMLADYVATAGKG